MGCAHRFCPRPVSHCLSSVLRLRSQCQTRGSKRVESAEFQSLLRKAFRDWAGTESEEKRVFVRNVLVNAAASKLTSDDVVKLFLKWIKDYSEFHFEVVGAVYNNAG